jgi:hypothetical protein
MAAAQQAPARPRPKVAIAANVVFRALLICAIILILSGAISAAVQAHATHPTAKGLALKFDLDSENTVPAWFSSTCLFLCALTLGFIAAAQWDDARGHGPRWVQVAILFVLLSLDEAASFHEKLARPMSNLLYKGEFIVWAWVIPCSIFGVLFLLTFSKFLMQLPLKTRRSFIVAGLIFCSGCIGMEVIGADPVAARETFNFPYLLMVITEESLEMLGAILFLRALLEYLATNVREVDIRWARPQ